MDDLIGTDTLLQMLYAYNDGPDGSYGVAAPAIGFDILRGPAFPSPGDTAIYFGKELIGFGNSLLYSSQVLIDGAPCERFPESAPDAYNYMSGLDRCGNPKLTPSGDTTRYHFTGDPVTGEGWILPFSVDLASIASTGPFTLAQGDSNELHVRGPDRTGYERSFQHHEASGSINIGSESI